MLDLFARSVARPSRPLCLPLAALACLGGLPAAQTLGETSTTKFVQEIRQSSTFDFAQNFAVEGDRMAVSDGFDVTIYEQSPASDWQLLIELNTTRIPSDLELDAGTLAVGMNDGDSVEIFLRNLGGADAWGLSRTLTSPNPSSNPRFGHGVALEQDTLIVSALGDGEQSQFETEGRVYVFDRNLGGFEQWGFVQEIVPPANTYREFGRAIRLDGDLLAVSSLELMGDFEGRVLLYRNIGGTWTLEATLEGIAGFGRSLDLCGDRLVVGTPFDRSNLNFGGKVELFGRNVGGANAWGSIQTLFPSDPGPGDNFGWSVSLERNALAVSASQSTPDPLVHASIGTVWVFAERTNGAWVEDARLRRQPVNNVPELFGWQVLLQGRDLYASDPGGGSHFVYRRAPRKNQSASTAVGTR